MNIAFADEYFELDPSGAVFWTLQETLIISDLHLGKITHFRKHGAALPTAAIDENFTKMDQVISCYKPQRVIFLGDLFHSNYNSEFDAFALWTERQAVQLHLVYGNHDLIDPARYEELGVFCEHQLSFDGIRLQHYPESEPEASELPLICGHVHPSYEVKGLTKQRIRLKCFHIQPNQLILPAFGIFTGSHPIQPKINDRVIVIAEDQLIAI